MDLLTILTLLIALYVSFVAPKLPDSIIKLFDNDFARLGICFLIAYTSSNNTATHTLTNSLGCDSVVTLNLTINNSNTGVDTQIACDSYTWNGYTYTTTGLYTN